MKPHSKMQIKVIPCWSWHNNNTLAMLRSGEEKRERRSHYITFLLLSFWVMRYFFQFFCCYSYIFSCYSFSAKSSVSLTPLTPSWNILYLMSSSEIMSSGILFGRNLSFLYVPSEYKEGQPNNNNRNSREVRILENITHEAYVRWCWSRYLSAWWCNNASQLKCSLSAYKTSHTAITSHIRRLTRVNESIESKHFILHAPTCCMMSRRLSVGWCREVLGVTHVVTHLLRKNVFFSAGLKAH